MQKYFDFYKNQKFEQASILKSSFNLEELIIAKNFEKEHKNFTEQKETNSRRVEMIHNTRLMMKEEIGHFRGIYISLDKMHSLSMSLRAGLVQKFKITNF